MRKTVQKKRVGKVQRSFNMINRASPDLQPKAIANPVIRLFAELPPRTYTCGNNSGDDLIEPIIEIKFVPKDRNTK